MASSRQLDDAYSDFISQLGGGNEDQRDPNVWQSSVNPDPSKSQSWSQHTGQHRQGVSQWNTSGSLSNPMPGSYHQGKQEGFPGSGNEFSQTTPGGGFQQGQMSQTFYQRSSTATLNPSHRREEERVGGLNPNVSDVRSLSKELGQRLIDVLTKNKQEGKDLTPDELQQLMSQMQQQFNSSFDTKQQSGSGFGAQSSSVSQPQPLSEQWSGKSVSQDPFSRSQMPEPQQWPSHQAGGNAFSPRSESQKWSTNQGISEAFSQQPKNEAHKWPTSQGTADSFSHPFRSESQKWPSEQRTGDTFSVSQHTMSDSQRWSSNQAAGDQFGQRLKSEIPQWSSNQGADTFSFPQDPKSESQRWQSNQTMVDFSQRSKSETPIWSSNRVSGDTFSASQYPKSESQKWQSDQAPRSNFSQSETQNLPSSQARGDGLSRYSQSGSHNWSSGHTAGETFSQQLKFESQTWSSNMAGDTLPQSRHQESKQQKWQSEDSQWDSFSAWPPDSEAKEKGSHPQRGSDDKYDPFLDTMPSPSPTWPPPDNATEPLSSQGRKRDDKRKMPSPPPSWPPPDNATESPSSQGRKRDDKHNRYDSRNEDKGLGRYGGDGSEWRRTYPLKVNDKFSSDAYPSTATSWSTGTSSTSTKRSHQESLGGSFKPNRDSLMGFDQGYAGDLKMQSFGSRGTNFGDVPSNLGGPIDRRRGPGDIAYHELQTGFQSSQAADKVREDISLLGIHALGDGQSQESDEVKLKSARDMKQLITMRMAAGNLDRDTEKKYHDLYGELTHVISNLERTVSRHLEEPPAKRRYVSQSEASTSPGFNSDRYKSGSGFRDGEHFQQPSQRSGFSGQSQIPSQGFRNSGSGFLDSSSRMLQQFEMHPSEMTKFPAPHDKLDRDRDIQARLYNMSGNRMSPGHADSSILGPPPPMQGRSEVLSNLSQRDNMQTQQNQIQKNEFNLPGQWHQNQGRGDTFQNRSVQRDNRNSEILPQMISPLQSRNDQGLGNTGPGILGQGPTHLRLPAPVGSLSAFEHPRRNVNMPLGGERQTPQPPKILRLMDVVATPTPETVELEKKRLAEEARKEEEEEAKRKLAKQKKEAAKEFKKTCKVCRITITSETAYDQHMNGKRHKTEVKKLEFQKKYPILNELPTLIEDKLKYVLCRKEESLYFCLICETNIQDEGLLEPHLQSSRHTDKLEKLKSIGTLYSAKQENGSVSLPVDNKGILKCLLCNIECQGQVNFEMHINSKKHKARVEEEEGPDIAGIQEAETPKLNQNTAVKEKTDVNLNQLVQAKEEEVSTLTVSERLEQKYSDTLCLICSTIMNGPADVHIASKKHIENLPALEELSSLGKIIEDFTDLVKTEETISRAAAVEKKFKAVNTAGGPNLQRMACTVCDIKFMTITNIQQHKRGTKHAIMMEAYEIVMKTKEVMEAYNLPALHALLQDYLKRLDFKPTSKNNWLCIICKQKFNSLQEHESHKTSGKHQKRFVWMRAIVNSLKLLHKTLASKAKPKPYLLSSEGQQVPTVEPAQEEREVPDFDLQEVLSFSMEERLKKVNHLQFCLICCVPLTDPIDYHNKKKMHTGLWTVLDNLNMLCQIIEDLCNPLEKNNALTKARKCEAVLVRGVDDTTGECALCNVTCTGFKHVMNHASGLKHLVLQHGHQVVVSAMKAVESKDLDLLRDLLKQCQEKMNVQQVSENEWTCNMCDLDLETQEVYQEHLRSSRHITKFICARSLCESVQRLYNVKAVTFNVSPAKPAAQKRKQNRDTSPQKKRGGKRDTTPTRRREDRKDAASSRRRTESRDARQPGKKGEKEESAAEKAKRVKEKFDALMKEKSRSRHTSRDSSSSGRDSSGKRSDGRSNRRESTSSRDQKSHKDGAREVKGEAKEVKGSVERREGTSVQRSSQRRNSHGQAKDDVATSEKVKSREDRRNQPTSAKVEGERSSAAAKKDTNKGDREGAKATVVKKGEDNVKAKQQKTENVRQEKSPSDSNSGQAVAKTVASKENVKKDRKDEDGQKPKQKALKATDTARNECKDGKDHDKVKAKSSTDKSTADPSTVKPGHDIKDKTARSRGDSESTSSKPTEDTDKDGEKANDDESVDHFAADMLGDDFIIMDELEQEEYDIVDEDNDETLLDVTQITEGDSDEDVHLREEEERLSAAVDVSLLTGYSENIQYGKTYIKPGHYCLMCEKFIQDPKVSLEEHCKTQLHRQRVEKQAKDLELIEEAIRKNDKSKKKTPPKR